MQDNKVNLLAMDKCNKAEQITIQEDKGSEHIYIRT